MNRRDRRVAGDHTPLVPVPEGEGDEPRIQLAQSAIEPAETASFPVWEWYRPSQAELAAAPQYRDHVERGGVLVRRRVGGLPAEAREPTDDEKRARVARLFGGSS